MADYNARFARDPANGKDLHRPLSAADDLDGAAGLARGSAR